jgi:hypothetical protein
MPVVGNNTHHRLVLRRNKNMWKLTHYPFSSSAMSVRIKRRDKRVREVSREVNKKLFVWYILVLVKAGQQITDTSLRHNYICLYIHCERRLSFIKASNVSNKRCRETTPRFSYQYNFFRSSTMFQIIEEKGVNVPELICYSTFPTHLQFVPYIHSPYMPWWRGQGQLYLSLPFVYVLVVTCFERHLSILYPLRIKIYNA